MANSTAIGLIRVSTPDQQLGLDAQRSAIQKYAAANGIDVLSIHTEIVSGGAQFHERDVLRAACQDLAVRGARYLIVAKRDRLSRQPMVALLVERSLEQIGASVLAVEGSFNGDDPASEFMRGVIDAVSQFERALIGARTRAALAALKAQGKVLGRPKGRVDTKPRKARSDKGRRRGMADPSTVELLKMADLRQLAPRKVRAGGIATTDYKPS